MIFTTAFVALDNSDGQQKVFEGPRITARNWKDAEAKIADRPYLLIESQLIGEVDEETGDRTYFDSEFLYWN